MRKKRKDYRETEQYKLMENRGQEKKKKRGKQKRKIVRKWGQILETEGMTKSFPLRHV